MSTIKKIWRSFVRLLLEIRDSCLEILFSCSSNVS